MSPQSKGRKRKKSGARGRSQPQGPESVIARVGQAVIRELERESVALDAEYAVSGVLGWALPGNTFADPEEELCEGLVAYAARKRRPGSVGLLRAIAVLGPERQREQAAAAADALVASGVGEPEWARELGTERVTGAWQYGDVFGDETSVLLVVERAGARHGVVALVDHNLDGIVTDAFVTDDPDGVLDDLRDPGDAATYHREITPESAGAVLVPAFAATDSMAITAIEPDVEEEFVGVRALARARVRLLPAPVPTPRPAPLDAAARTAVVDEFLGSAEARDLPPAARGCAELLVEFGNAADPARPLRVGPGLIDRFLDQTLNGGPDLSDDEYEALPATVRAWASWAARRADLSAEAVAELQDAVDDMVCSIGRPGDPEPFADNVADAYLAGLDLDELGPEELVEVLERRMFAIPAVGTRIGDEEFPFLDPSDADDRGMLIEGEHPEYHEALADPDSETVEGVNPRLHITVHEIIANQLWDDEPPEVWQAAQRLLATGTDRHDVLHAIGEVLIEHLWGVLSGQGPTDPARYVEEIDKLGRTEGTGRSTVTPLRRKR